MTSTTKMATTPHGFIDESPINGLCDECGSSVQFHAQLEWKPEFSPWRHGGWYVDNLRYPSGAVGCVSRNYPDGKWRIVCDPRPFEKRPTFPNRIAAAHGERDLIAVLSDAQLPERDAGLCGSWWVSTHDPLVVIDENHQPVLRGQVATVADTEKVKQIVATTVTQYNSHASFIAALERTQRFLLLLTDAGVLDQIAAEHSHPDEVNGLCDAIDEVLKHAREGE